LQWVVYTSNPIQLFSGSVTAPTFVSGSAAIDQTQTFITSARQFLNHPCLPWGFLAPERSSYLQERCAASIKATCAGLALGIDDQGKVAAH
jgi:hypothetical protein